MRNKALKELKPIKVIPLGKNEQEEKEFHEWGKYLLKKIAKYYRVQSKKEREIK